MKHVPCLSTEPPGLAAYRQAHPADDAAPPEEASNIWNRFRDDAAYKELLKALVDVQQGLCIYCEQRLVDAHGALQPLDYQVEHVEPKSGAPGRVLAWRNLAAACCGGSRACLNPKHPTRYYKDERGCGGSEINESCGQRKGERALGRGCDPRTFAPGVRLMDVGLDGSLTASSDACASQGLGASDLQDTLDEVLNLNCERLRVARQNVFDNIRGWLVDLLRAILDGAHLTPLQERQSLDLLIAGRLQPDGRGYLHPFWTTERCALGAPADDWIGRNLAIFQCETDL